MTLDLRAQFDELVRQHGVTFAARAFTFVERANQVLAARQSLTPERRALHREMAASARMIRLERN